MAQLPRWELRFLHAKDGSDPFTAFVSSLSLPAQLEWETLLRLVQRRGDTLQGSRLVIHKNELYEFKGDEVRIFYKQLPQHKQILVLAGLRLTDGEEFLQAILREAESV
jgi:hypothetical protein